jgi:hypothetical protein
VPLVSGRQPLIDNHSERVIFAELKLVADYREFTVQGLPGNVGIDHAIRLEVEGPFQVYIGSGERLEIVGPIK